MTDKTPQAIETNFDKMRKRLMEYYYKHWIVNYE